LLTDALILPEGDFQAWLFDLDGTLADSMPQHFISWTHAVENHGGKFPEKLFYEWGGVTPLAIVRRLNEKFGFSMDPETVVHQKESLYLEQIHNVKPIESVLNLLEANHGRIPFAVVTGSPRLNATRALAALNLTDRFQTVVAAEDYTHGKPNPEPFLTAANRLGIPPSSCLVFEDADPGIAAASAAGMQWVRVPVNLPENIAN